MYKNYSKGDKVKVSPESECMQKYAPATKWLKEEIEVELLENAISGT